MFDDDDIDVYVDDDDVDDGSDGDENYQVSDKFPLDRLYDMVKPLLSSNTSVLFLQYYDSVWQYRNVSNTRDIAGQLWPCKDFESTCRCHPPLHIREALV